MPKIYRREDPCPKCGASYVWLGRIRWIKKWWTGQEWIRVHCDMCGATFDCYTKDLWNG